MTDFEDFDKSKFKYILINTMGFDIYYRLGDEMMNWIRWNTRSFNSIYFRVNDCTYFGLDDPEEAVHFRLVYGSYLNIYGSQTA